MTEAPVLQLLDFDQVFEVAIDVSHVGKEFIIFTEHEAFKHLHLQKSVNNGHAKWVAYLQEFIFVFKYKVGKAKTLVDALSIKVLTLHTFSANVTSIDHIKDKYVLYKDFSAIYQML
ncbi:uncharacterized protein LOC122665641 [Telopea speciosissima]|uniref:uncharacterized protein LOC122665641 n=1 Tax=Telopea speciosissima TaxID=54955 RepID=UPI001CC34B05|nr:uncharacterized protein LOC122665641 [Telopea speciosissima]